ncbi:MAG: 3-deoxy-manno-octulosonate cytidylyltransferase, partial [Acidobacteriota bacterium]
MKGNRSQVIVVIPARYGSTRLQGKPLLDLAGKTIIQRVYEQALQAKTVDHVLVATDDERIRAAVAAFGGEAVMTSAAHQTGTDRIAEVAGGLAAEIVVNVQGDEPMIDPVTIDLAVEPLLTDPALMMSTTCEPIDSIKDLFNPNIVKVVLDDNGNALYFSRAPIPFPRELFQHAQAAMINLEQYVER